MSLSDNLKTLFMNDTTIRDVRFDDQNANLIYIGLNKVTSANETANTWKVGRFSISGLKSYLTWADSSKFTRQWSQRTTYFPAVQFENNYSAQFLGSANQNATVPHFAAIDFANSAAFSFSHHLKSSYTSAYTLLQKTATALGNNGYTLSVNGSWQIEFEFRASGTGDRILVRANTPTVPIASNAWHHLLITKATGTAASTVKMYLNGVAQTLTILNDTLVGTTTNGLPLYLASTIVSSMLYRGNIDELAFWNVELTAAEVTEIYNSNQGCINLQTGSGQIAANLVSWHRMGDGAVYPTIPNVIGGAQSMTMGAGTTSGDIESETPP